MDTDIPNRRFVIIANPTAGRGSGSPLAERVQAGLVGAGVESRIEYSSAQGGAEVVAGLALAKSAAAGDARGDLPLCLVACGGDGTTQEVVNAIMKAGGGAALGLAPAGRCNDFASALGIPRDADSIVRMLLCGAAKRVDLGRVNERYFCTIAAFGFDAAVSRFVNEMKMPLWGTPAYVYGVLRVLRGYRATEARITTDEETRVGPVFMMASANTASYGGQMRVAPGADPCDGRLDVCHVGKIKRLRVLRLLNRVIKGRHTSLEEVRLMRTRQVRIECDGEREIWADGEFVGRTPAVIEAVEGAISVIGPQGGSGA